MTTYIVEVGGKTILTTEDRVEADAAIDKALSRKTRPVRLVIPHAKP